MLRERERERESKKERERERECEPLSFKVEFLLYLKCFDSLEKVDKSNTKNISTTKGFKQNVVNS